MNPFSRFKNYITGEALAATDDVFEKSRIDLTFNITVFFIILGLTYYINLFVHHFTYLIYITTIGIISLPTVLIVLKTTKNVRYAGYFFVFEQLLVGFCNECMGNFHIEAMGAFWTMVVILFAFFVLGVRWGWAVGIYSTISILIGMINEHSGYKYFHFDIPANQIPEAGPFFILMPIAIVLYSIYRIVSSRNMAEKQISLQKSQLERNNRELGLKNEDIISSINYAKKIQYAVLPNEETIYRSIPLSFIIYKPRDIVSGDFFWFHEADANTYTIVAADCTGHGVPGAFMTVIGSNALTQTVIENKITKPSEILTELDNRVTHTLKQEKTHYGLVQDGMDLALLKINKLQKELIFTSAKRPAFFIRNGSLREIKGSKSSIGGLRSEEKIFEEIVISYQDDDMIYLFSDGYVDQFGGTNNKKFTTRRLRELLLGIYQLPVNEQKERIEKTFANWKGENEQTDDMLVIGIRF